MTPDPIKRLNNNIDNRVLRKRKQKNHDDTTQSDPLEDKIVGISPNVWKIDAESDKRYVDLIAIKKTLLSAEISKFLRVSNTPPNFSVDTCLSYNSSNAVSGTNETEAVMIST